MNSFISSSGLAYLWSKIKEYVSAHAGTYSKPSGGIPKSDLSSPVQQSLDKADTALQIGDVLSEITNNSNYPVASTAIYNRFSSDEKITSTALNDLNDRLVYTSTNVNSLINNKANKSTTLSGYGITDAYTKNETYSKNETNGKYITSIGLDGDMLTKTINGSTSNVTNILQRSRTVSFTVEAVGWYRIASFRQGAASSNTVLLFLQRTFNHQNNESYIFAVTSGYSGKANITQLSGTINAQMFTKIRVDNANSGYGSIDIYCNSASSNTVGVTIVGSANPISEPTLNPTTVGTLTEFDIVSHLASNTIRTDNITAKNSNGLLSYKPADWAGVSTTQWGLGTGDAQGVIRSNANDIIHWKNGTNYIILDTSNYRSHADSCYYSLNGGTDVAATSSSTKNLNTYTIVGSYYLNQSSNAQYVSNKPTTTNKAFRMWVTASTGTSSAYKRQRFRYYDDFNVYERYSINSGSSWTTWRTVQQDASSDERIKDKVGDINIDIKDIADAPNITFTYKDIESKELHGGSLAQYWENITPYYVHGDESKTLDYSNLALSCSIELAKEVVRLKKENAQFKEELSGIKEKLQKLNI